jgi:hypothetical protein
MKSLKLYEHGTDWRFEAAQTGAYYFSAYLINDDNVMTPVLPMWSMGYDGFGYDSPNATGWVWDGTVNPNEAARIAALVELRTQALAIAGGDPAAYNLAVMDDQTFGLVLDAATKAKEAREEAAVENALRNGTTDYSLLLGPAWRTKFEALAEQLDVARESGLPLSVFTMKSGGAADEFGHLDDAGAEREKLPKRTGNDTDENGRDTQTTDGEAEAGTTADTTLNGAQIEAALEIIARLTRDEITSATAVELLVAVGIKREDAERMVAEEMAVMEKRRALKKQEQETQATEETE